MKTVMYQEKLYKVVHKYISGYWEIRELKDKSIYNIILVNSTVIRKSNIYRSTGVRSLRTLTDVLRIARHFSKQAVAGSLCVYRSDFSWALSRPIRFVCYATNQRNVLLNNCFRRAISRLCSSTKLSHPALHKSTSTEFRVSVVFPIKKALYKSR